MTAEYQAVATFPFAGDLSLLFMAGDPIKQAQTPALLNQKFLETGTRKLVVPVNVKPNGFTEFTSFFRCVQNAAGMLVTVPHKKALFDLSDRPTARARLLGFANVARINDDGVIESDCLDGDALIAALHLRNFAAFAKTAVIAGCGGAGAAYAEALVRQGIRLITLIDPESQRAQLLQANLSRLRPDVKLTLASSSSDLTCDLLINASPVGMKSQAECVFHSNTIQAASIVVDATSPPWKTQLVLAATANNLVVIDGHQLAAAQTASILEYFWPA
jgi:shikimate dehydrogenase